MIFSCLYYEYYSALIEKKQIFKYDKVSITRTKKLNQVIEKIKGENVLENNNSNKLE